jgi:nucleotide-binding universal stress UspA family protein
MTNTIVVGYDGSDQSDRALARAAELADALRAKLVVVSVARPAHLAPHELGAEPIDPMLVTSGLAGPLMTGSVTALPAAPAADRLEEAQAVLARARDLLARRHVDADYLAEAGDPAERLLGIADERDARLIVVGTRERGLLARIVGHCVDEKLARQAQRDVLLVQ